MAKQMIAFKQFLKNPFLLLTWFHYEFKFFLIRKDFYTKFLNIRHKIILFRMAWRLVGKYDIERAGSTIIRWNRMQDYRIKKNLRQLQIELTEKIAMVAKKLDVPEYEIRMYLENKIDDK